MLLRTDKFTGKVGEYCTTYNALVRLTSQAEANEIRENSEIYKNLNFAIANAANDYLEDYGENVWHPNRKVPAFFGMKNEIAEELKSKNRSVVNAFNTKWLFTFLDNILKKESKTRKKLLNDIHLLVPNADENQIATAIGTIGETIICNHFNWRNIDEDGYDALDGWGKKYEIKTMSNETKTHYVAYNHKKKKDRYDYLAIYHYDLERVSVIPKEVINEYYNTISTTLRLNFNESLQTKLGKERQSARFQAIFCKYEVKSFNRK